MLLTEDKLFYENAAYKAGYEFVAGVDEAGRGPLAGPVFAAAVILRQGQQIAGVDDSKKLSEKKRETLYAKINEEAFACAIGMATCKEIDELNIVGATFLAMRRAIFATSPKADFVLVDGNLLPKIKTPAQAIVKGDSLSASIAAASILAKVERDRYMQRLAGKHPQYSFEKHKGYPTKAHYAAIEEYGIIAEHRLTFLKNFDEKHRTKPLNHSAAVGSKGESFTVNYLAEHGYQVLEQNFHSRYGEVDVIAKLGEDTIVFVEVKTRSQHFVAPPAQSVTKNKQKKIIETAKVYLGENIDKYFIRFDVMEVIVDNAENISSFNYLENAFTL